MQPNLSILLQQHQLTPEELEAMKGIAAVVLLVAFVGVVIAYGILIGICVFISGCFKRVPAQFRKQEPGMVWLLLIPCFNIVWMFFVLPKLAESYKAYFDSVGKTDVGDCGYNLALWYCILIPCNAVASFIPIINLLTIPAGIAGLVLLILFLVKAGEYKKLMPAA